MLGILNTKIIVQTNTNRFPLNLQKLMIAMDLNANQINSVAMILGPELGIVINHARLSIILKI